MITKIFLPISLLISSLSAAEKDPKFTWTDPEKAAAESPAFSMQGEYYDKDAAHGAQVVALGEGRFDVYVLEGGLPGLGWEKGNGRTRLAGILQDGIVTFTELKGVSALLDEKQLLIKHSGEEAMTLPRISRKSPSLGKAAPDGASVLFDGKDTKQWTKGEIENGLLKSTGATSIPKFKSYQLHLEFRTPFMPRAKGQGRGNSGVYFGGRWETQILDSFGLDGKMNECGGIYSIAEPRLNMCLPPLTWQTYDVDFTAATFHEKGKRTAWPRITVKLNGVVIHDDQELKKDYTTAAPGKGPLRDEALPLFLQNHGNPVFFRNIWLLPKK